MGGARRVDPSSWPENAGLPPDGTPTWHDCPGRDRGTMPVSRLKILAPYRWRSPWPALAVGASAPSPSAIAEDRPTPATGRAESQAPVRVQQDGRVLPVRSTRPRGLRLRRTSAPSRARRGRRALPPPTYGTRRSTARRGGLPRSRRVDRPARRQAGLASSRRSRATKPGRRPTPRRRPGLPARRPPAARRARRLCPRPAARCMLLAERGDGRAARLRARSRRSAPSAPT